MGIYNTIAEFRSHVKTVGLPTASHFNVILPSSLGAGYNNPSFKLSEENVVSMLCEATSVPGVNIMSDELRIVGEVTDIPYMISYPPINLTFIEDNTFVAKKYFEAWTNQVYDRKTRQAGYYDDVTGEVQIMVSDREGNTRYCIKLHKAYPKMISDQQFSYSSHDIIKTEVQFSYKYWERIGTNSSGEPTVVAGVFSTEVQNLLTDLQNSEASETLSDFGGGTGNSSGLFGDDIGSDLSEWGPKIGADFDRTCRGAGAVLSTSGVTGGEAMGGAFSDMGGSMGKFGQVIGDLGKSLADIGSISGRVGQAVGGIAGTVGAVNQVLSGLGINTGLGKVAADISQVGGKLGVLGQLGGLPGNLGSLGANMGAVGSEINRAVDAIGGLPGATNQVKNVISNVGSLFNSRGSELSEASSSIQSGIDGGWL